MSDDPLIFRNPDGTVTEFGPDWGNNFGGGTLYDSKGKEVKIPECDKCRGLKSMMIGRDAFDWVCFGCMNTQVGDG